jgi:hypothetical protein
MVARMKTTIDIADALLADAKRVASQGGITLRDLVEDGLRRVIADRKQPQHFKLRDGSFRGEGLQPGIRDGDWEQIRDLIYDGHGA